jgi:hypothetical protein
MGNSPISTVYNGIYRTNWPSRMVYCNVWDICRFILDLCQGQLYYWPIDLVERESKKKDWFKLT